MVSKTKIKWDESKRFDIVYVKAYRDTVIGFIDWIDDDTMGIKCGFGRGTNFVLWKKHKHTIYKLGNEE